MDSFTITFETEKETKNTIRYSEVPANGEPPKVGTLYLQKWAVQKLGNPKRITVEVAAS